MQSIGVYSLLITLVCVAFAAPTAPPTQSCSIAKQDGQIAITAFNGAKKPNEVLQTLGNVLLTTEISGAPLTVKADFEADRSDFSISNLQIEMTIGGAPARLKTLLPGQQPYTVETTDSNGTRISTSNSGHFTFLPGLVTYDVSFSHDYAFTVISIANRVNITVSDFALSFADPHIELTTINQQSSGLCG